MNELKFAASVFTEILKKFDPILVNGDLNVVMFHLLYKSHLGIACVH